MNKKIHYEWVYYSLFAPTDTVLLPAKGLLRVFFSNYCKKILQCVTGVDECLWLNFETPCSALFKLQPELFVCVCCSPL